MHRLTLFHCCSFYFFLVCVCLCVCVCCVCACVCVCVCVCACVFCVWFVLFVCFASINMSELLNLHLLHFMQTHFHVNVVKVLLYSSFVNHVKQWPQSLLHQIVSVDQMLQCFVGISANFKLTWHVFLVGGDQQFSVTLDPAFDHLPPLDYGCTSMSDKTKYWCGQCLLIAEYNHQSM